MAKAAAQGGVAAGGAVAMKYDPSARLKTVPRMFNAATPTTRWVSFFAPITHSTMCW